MKQAEFLSLRNRPLILTRIEAGHLLGLHPDAIAYLARKGHLPPLGRIEPGVPLLFSTEEVAALGRDRKWLSRAVMSLRAHYAARNARVTSEEADAADLKDQT